MNKRKGYVSKDKNGKWFCRVTATDATGRRKDIRRIADSKSDARSILIQLVRDLDDGGIRVVQTWNRTFRDLVDLYEAQYAIPARFVNGQKVGGMRGSRIVRTYTACFRPFFGSKPVKEITYADIASFRNSRLNKKTYKGKPRNIATVNRELACLRRMFNIALQRGWILRNPFSCGDALILTSCEKRRERILDLAEETRLLAACDDPKRSHLRALLIALLDTGARKGEMLKLKWCDVDLHLRTVTFQALNTKTLRERTVAITERLLCELRRLWDASNGVMDSLVFGSKSESGIDWTLATACKIAGIKHGGLDGLTLHCLRHTAATRLVKGQLPIQMVGRILGHTQVSTTYRYLTADNETAKQAASILEAYQVNEAVYVH